MNGIPQSFGNFNFTICVNDNVIKIQEKDKTVSQPRNRWIVQTILVLAILAFIGVSVIPLFGAFNNTPAASTRGTLTSADQKSKLEDQVRGYELVLQREPENQ